ncbi:phosphate ABC transporter substrate-binding protein [Campylobacter upsaliensis]|uniref:substrate-binding domain-containing protein n=1 Tax=Campylobacter upsaliensis TaxID=28080 RepID=UPI0012C4A464|nr:substrate-binding domain-containing protein [Campylobacter upsaliensis]EAK0297575.1 phosphate ABC transporter substrate-binding protein [Campylobacter upsaliensis]MCR2118148.1 substrate-binding domain-containing protein [Campylobacter upsaliensis]
MKKYALGLLAGLVLSTSVMAENIFPISREQGSGTRGAFVEIFEIQKKVKDKKIDATTQKAEVTNSTGVMLTTVANSKNSIGYISLGSLNDSVKALQIDGVAPSVENINNKSYKISRPFNVVTKTTNPLIEDFLKYSTSIEAKAIVEKAGYIATAKASFQSTKPEGKLIVAGSSSVTPLMEKLAESYKAVNSNAVIEIQQSDSTTGVNSVVEGIADIGMVSREVKDSELKKGVTPLVLAIDGLAVIVNKSNGVENLSKDSVKKIFMGEITDWQDAK